MIEFIEKYKWALSVLAIFGIEFAPIKLSPLTWLGHAIAKWLGITRLEAAIKNVKHEVDNNEIDRIRYEILQFSSSLRNGADRSDVEYEHIEDIFKKYLAYGANSYIKTEMDYIREYRHTQGN